MRRRFSARAVLFDWDNTLLDSYHADARAYLAMFRSLGIHWGLAELERHYSPNWHRVYRAAGLPRSRWEEADRLWENAYRKENPQLLPGARRILSALDRKFLLGLVTSGNRRRVHRQLRKFGFTELFAVRVCSEDAPHRKPHPAPLQLALERLRLPPADCVYVGDTPEDVEMSKRAGVRALAILGPNVALARVRAARPDALLDSLLELPRWLTAVPE